MFIKSFKIKTSTAIRGSDRRKLRSDVQRSFPNVTADDLTGLIPNKDDMTVTKITTHSGEMAVFYSLNGEPIFFELEKRIYPTVYSLWKHPSLVTLNFVTWSPVLEKLANGADLMLPGVVLPPEGLASLECFEKDQICTVSLKGNKSVVAVGVTTVSRKDLYEDGMRGKGVKILHVFTDFLWAHGSKTMLPQVDEITEQEPHQEEDDEEHEQQAETESQNEENPALCLDEQLQTLTIDQPDQESQETDNATAAVGVDDTVEEGGKEETIAEVENQGNDSENGLPLDSMDDLLHYCFFCAALRVKEQDLPLLTSAFFRNHMLSYCPEGKSLDIKKSSFKKLSKFLQSIQDRGIMVIQELSKGVDSITAIIFTHEEFRSFKSSLESLPPKPSASSTATTEQKVGPLIEEMVSVSGSTARLFADVGYRKGAVFSSSDARKVVTEYVKKHELVQKNNQRMVVLDPIITNAVVNKNEDITSMTWDNLFTRILNKMNSCYQITLVGQPPVFRKGKIDPLELKIEQRMGNKKVTLVRNLDMYGIDPQDFAHRIQLKAASSTSVSQLPGKNAAKQVLIQGNQVSMVASALLDDYKIPKKYISGLELLKSKKKK